jgi:hypothetical protein
MIRTTVHVVVIMTVGSLAIKKALMELQYITDDNGHGWRNFQSIHEVIANKNIQNITSGGCG